MKYLNFMETVIDFTANVSKKIVEIVDTGLSEVVEGVKKCTNTEENNNGKTDTTNREL